MPTSSQYPVGDEAYGFANELGELERRVTMRRGTPADDPNTESLLEELGTAYEELRVADEEVRTQHGQVTALLERERLVLARQERMMALLPVAIIGTDRSGMIRSANAAAAELTGRGVARMVGRPVINLVAVEDRAAARPLLGRGGTDADTDRPVVRLVARDETEVRVQLGVFSPGSTSAIVWWLLLPAGLYEGASRANGDLPGALSRLALLPGSVTRVEEALGAAAAACQDGLGSATSVSLVIGSPRSPTSLVTTSQLAQEADGAQMVAGEGPSLVAFQSSATVESADVAVDDRWPRLTGRLPPPVRAVVAAPLVVGEKTVGVLTAYHTASRPDALRRDDVELLAVTVSGVLLELRLRQELEELAADMERAMESRAAIEQAKGIVMALRRVDADEAFRHLVELSSTRHLKLRDVARQIVDSVVARE